MNKISLMLLLFVALHSTAQPVVNVEGVKQKYPGIGFYTLKQNEHIEIKNSGSKLNIKTTSESSVLLLNDHAVLNSERSIYYYNTFSEISDIDARTWVPDGSRFKQVKVNEIFTRKPAKSGVFYDDFMEKYFYYPSLRPGSVISLKYDEEIFDPHMLPAFYFGGSYPIEEARFSVTFPSSVKLKYLYKGNPDAVKFEEKKGKNETTYTWQSVDVPKFESEDNAPDPTFVVPKVVLYIDEFDNNNVQEKVLPDVKHLYKWYSTLLTDVWKEEHNDTKKLADSLTAGIKGDDAKAKALFYWVQDHIKYIAFEDGLGGFIPRPASEVQRKRYGDCKDKATLLCELLRAAGLNGYRAWIGTRDIDYTYAELPSPQVDNHMITAYNNGSKWYFFDATADQIYFDTPTSMIQGKEALIGINADSFLVMKVPEMEMERNKIKSDYTISISNDTVSGNAVELYTGYVKENVFARLTADGLSKVKENAINGLYIGNNKHHVDTFSYSGLADRDSVLAFRYKFNLMNYVTIADDEMYLNMNLKKPYVDDIIDIGKRKNDRIFDFRFVDENATELSTGKKVAGKLPPDRKYEGKNFGFSIRYENSAGKIIMHRKVYIDTLLLKMNQFKEWNDFIEQLSSAYKETIVLKTTK
ncbi:MAG: DUF3857 and transglutaminase domain-containing protein [Bacteroidota bacterium]